MQAVVLNTPEGPVTISSKEDIELLSEEQILAAYRYLTKREIKTFGTKEAAVESLYSQIQKIAGVAPKETEAEEDSADNEQEMEAMATKAKKSTKKAVKAKAPKAAKAPKVAKVKGEKKHGAGKGGLSRRIKLLVKCPSEKINVKGIRIERFKNYKNGMTLQEVEDSKTGIFVQEVLWYVKNGVMALEAPKGE